MFTAKMALDATPKADRPPLAPASVTVEARRFSDEISGWRMLEDCLLAVQVSGEAKATLQRLASAPELAGVKIIAAVSQDVDLNDEMELLWGIFTRFDPARDLQFPEMRLVGASPVYRGPMAIDATFKPGYPAPLEMDPDIVERVTRRWDEYFAK